MAGYAIQTRLEGVRPRLTALDDQPLTRATSGWSAVDGEPLHLVAPIVADEGPLTALPDRWERLHEVWAQTTFFLFSGDSWR